MPPEPLKTVGDLRRVIADLPDDMVVALTTTGGGLQKSISLGVHEVASALAGQKWPDIARALIIRGRP